MDKLVDRAGPHDETDPDQVLYEYACHEGNLGLRNILHNARYAEDPNYADKLPAPDRN